MKSGQFGGLECVDRYGAGLSPDHLPAGTVAPRDDGWASKGARMSRKILIVEDNDLNMKLFHDLLEVHGYETVQTKDGREVLHLAKEHRPDLILMDI